MDSPFWYCVLTTGFIEPLLQQIAWRSLSRPLNVHSSHPCLLCPHSWVDCLFLSSPLLWFYRQIPYPQVLVTIATPLPLAWFPLQLVYLTQTPPRLCFALIQILSLQLLLCVSPPPLVKIHAATPHCILTSCPSLLTDVNCTEASPIPELATLSDIPVMQVKSLEMKLLFL